MRRIIFHLTSIITCMVLAWPLMPISAAISADEQDFDESIRLPVRRLHPERNKKKADTDATGESKNADAESANPDDFSQRMRRERARLQRKSQAEADSGQSVTDIPQQTPGTDKAWLDKLLSTDYTIKSIEDYMPQRLRWTDEPVGQSQSQLLPYFSSTILPDGTTRYMPKDVRMENNYNGLYLYFDTNRGKPQGLRLRAQYYADDALDIERVDFIINGFKYGYTPLTVNRGKGNGRMVWENFDDAVGTPMKDLVYALTHGHAVIVKFVGSRGFSHVKELTADEIKDMYRTLELYRAMGGSI